MDDEIRLQDLAADEIRDLLLEEGSELDEQQAAAVKKFLQDIGGMENALAAIAMLHGLKRQRDSAPPATPLLGVASLRRPFSVHQVRQSINRLLRLLHPTQLLRQHLGLFEPSERDGILGEGGSGGFGSWCRSGFRLLLSLHFGLDGSDVVGRRFEALLLH